MGKIYGYRDMQDGLTIPFLQERTLKFGRLRAYGKEEKKGKGKDKIAK